MKIVGESSQSTRISAFYEFSQNYIREMNNNCTEALFRSIEKPYNPRTTISFWFTKPFH